jgi:adenosine deaminase CECR1
MFHAGETLLDTGGSTEPSDSNLYDTVPLESNPISHWCSLREYPYLIEIFRKKSKSDQWICIELCPTSNEPLHLCRNMEQHPFPEFLTAGIPCSLNTDNPNLFG